MNYIERQQRGEFFNPVSGTVAINPDSDGSGSETHAENEYDQNLGRWKWLIDGWKDMSFIEKMSLFLNHYHYINLRDIKKVDFDESLNTELLDTQYELCRVVKKVKFDPDGQGIPNLLVEFGPVMIMAIPDWELRQEIIRWGTKYGFYDSDYIPPEPRPCPPCPPCNCENYVFNGSVPGAQGTQGCNCVHDVDD